MALSLDGFIADNDGGFSWIHGDGNNENDTSSKFNFSEFLESIDVIVMGRKSYEDCPKETLESFQSKKLCIATSSAITNLRDNEEVIEGDVCSKIREISKSAQKSVWVFGGADIANQFIKSDMVDEYVLGVIPVILGGGRRLFSEDNPMISLSLSECTVQEGIVISRYLKK